MCSEKANYIFKRLVIFWRDNDRKNIFRVCYECLIYCWVKKELPFYYFGKFLYRNDVSNYLDYLSQKEILLITNSKNLHSQYNAKILQNKLEFSIHVSKKNLKSPELYSYNFCNDFVLTNKTYHLHGPKELHLFFADVFVKYGIDRIFLKPIIGKGGQGCLVLNHKSLKAELESYAQQILNHNYIHQEFIIQHDQISRIYSGSLNTLRFKTYIDRIGKVKLISSCMRFGSNGSIVDNSSAGGLALDVDLEYGKLKGKSYQSMRAGANRYERHPDTKIMFDGFVIPFFENAKNLAIKAVEAIPERFVGWDIAISQNGPVLIEGNEDSSLVGPDITYGGFLKIQYSKKF